MKGGVPFSSWAHFALQVTTGPDSGLTGVEARLESDFSGLRLFNTHCKRWRGGVIIETDGESEIYKYTSPDQRDGLWRDLSSRFAGEKPLPL